VTAHAGAAATSAHPRKPMFHFSSRPAEANIVVTLPCAAGHPSVAVRHLFVRTINPGTELILYGDFALQHIFAVRCGGHGCGATCRIRLPDNWAKQTPVRLDPNASKIGTWRVLS